jgi:hypothetical protein
MQIITMMTTWCERAYNINHLVNFLNVRIHDTWVGHMTTRREIEIEHIRSVGFREHKRGSDITEVRVCLQKWTIQNTHKQVSSTVLGIHYCTIVQSKLLEEVPKGPTIVLPFSHSCKQWRVDSVMKLIYHISLHSSLHAHIYLSSH